MSADLTCATVHVGCRWSRRAAAPAVCGAAMLVPSKNRHEPSRAGTDESTPTPGAVTSGFSRSETGAGPPDENSAISPDLVAAAAVIAFGAEPGESIEPGPSTSKSFPAAIMGTTPASAAASIACTTMSRDGVISGSPRERLITSMPSRTARSIPATISGELPSSPKAPVGIVSTR